MTFVIPTRNNLPYVKLAYSSIQKYYPDEEIIVMDHMNCGAYKLLYNNNNLSASDELELHKANLAQFVQTINAKYPEYKVTTLLMYLDGSVVDASLL